MCTEKNAGEHMMSGEAVTRVIRGYFLTSSHLFTILLIQFSASFDQNNTQPDNNIYDKMFMIK